MQKDAAKGPHITLLGQLVLELLGSSPFSSALMGRVRHHSFINVLGNTHVDDLYLLVIGAEQDILRL